MEIRRLRITDYEKGYLSLLKQLTQVGNMNQTDFEICFDKLNTNVYVIELDGIIVASGTLYIEHKFIHQGSSVGHIEDIVVDNNYRGKNLGKEILHHLINIAQINKCYKIILNCEPKLEKFYEKFGFTKKNIEMSKYFD